MSEESLHFSRVELLALATDSRELRPSERRRLLLHLGGHIIQLLLHYRNYI